MRGQAVLKAAFAFAVFSGSPVTAQTAGPGDALAQAKTASDAGRFEEAERLTRSYLASNTASADGEYLLGFVLFRRNQPRESLAAFTRAAALRRPTAAELKVVGLDYVLLGDLTDGIRWLERSVAEDPRDAEAAYHLGRAYYTQNSFEQAMAAFERALRLNPLYGKAQNNLGLTFAALGRADRAEGAYRRAIELDRQSGHRSQEPYVNLAELLLEHQRAADAVAPLDEAAAIKPKSERFDEVRGRVCLMLERLDDAERSFRAAIAAHPEIGALHYQLGRVLKREGKTDEARREFDHSQALLGARSQERR